MELRAKYKRTIYEADGNARIALYETDSEEITITGNFLPTIANITYIFECKEKMHPKYGKQYEAERYEEVLDGTESILAYLGSGIVKGLGYKTAQKIVAVFGERTLQVMDDDIDRISTIKGIGGKTFEKVKENYAKTRAMRDVIMTLSSHGISARMSSKIYEYFKEDAESDSLEVAMEELGSDYDEMEVRLVRIKFLCEVAN